MMIGNVKGARFTPDWTAPQLVVLGLIAASLTIQAWLIFVQEFNWDEFYFLGLIHDYLRGDLDKALQTFHVHLFAPLVGLPGDEIDQLIAGRCVMLLCQAVSIISLYRLCRIWADRGHALLAVCAFALLPATLQHGASFRADPLALAFSMAALAWLGRSRPTPIAAFGIALSAALAALVTIKVVFFAPAFVGLAIWRLSNSPNRAKEIRWLAATGALTLAIFFILYLGHQASLKGSSVDGSAQMARGAAHRMLLETPLFPRSRTLLDMVLRSPFQSLLLAAAAIFLFFRATRADDRIRSIAILGFVAPALCFAAYRNAYPYFVPFIFAPGFTAVAFLSQANDWQRPLRLVLSIMMAAAAIPSIYWIAHERSQEGQRQVIAAVHEVFPHPVGMIDHNHMIATFPSSGFLMSTWGMNNYLAGPPIFSTVLADEVVPLAILNGKPLQHAMGLIPQDPSFFALHPKDRAFLRQNYIPHWGPIWVAGQRLGVGETDRRFTVAIPGEYTVEDGDARLDGKTYARGDVVRLRRGTHTVAGTPNSVVTLRWGEHLPRPAASPPAKPLVVGF